MPAVALYAAAALFFGTRLFADTLHWYLPVASSNRQSIKSVTLTKLGGYGMIRKPRPGIPLHLHSGIDINRPNDNYSHEPIFPAAPGVVISVRNDGPYAQIIIEHATQDSSGIWTVYEHTGKILVTCGDTVGPNDTIALFMTREELHRHGWQFDHVHFEIMKRAPQKVPESRDLPLHLFCSYGLTCYNKKILSDCYENPLRFLQSRWAHANEQFPNSQ
jgi:murein DD-endopeptidase MepM/ murein hydrolase activator NlpD